MADERKNIIGNPPTIDDITDFNERDFLEGVLEVYGEIFSKKVKFFPLDEQASKVNTYGESFHKVYSEPVELNARIVIEAKNGEKAVERTYNQVTVSIPTLDMWNKGLDTTKDCLTEMRKGKFEWNGISYQIKRIKPKTMINDTFIIHKFYCEEYVSDERSDEYGTVYK